MGSFHTGRVAGEALKPPATSKASEPPPKALAHEGVQTNEDGDPIAAPADSPVAPSVDGPPAPASERRSVMDGLYAVAHNTQACSTWEANPVPLRI